MRSDALKNAISKWFWKVGLTPISLPQQRQELLLAEYPQWHIRCHQSRQWFLWALFDDAKSESPDPSGHFSLITVDRRDDSALVTFELSLLEAWLAADTPFVIPRRKRRMGFAHHSYLETLENNHDVEIIPMLASRKLNQPILISIPLRVFKQWLACFPSPQRQTLHEGEQMSLTLWNSSKEAGT